MNVFTFTGRLGKDAEVRHTASGHAICSFSVAVESGWADKKTTTWVRCSLFGKRAESGLTQYLTKGAMVAVSGEFSAREYEANGEKRTSIEVRVGELDLIGGRKEEKPEPKQQAASDFDDADLPF